MCAQARAKSIEKKKNEREKKREGEKEKRQIVAITKILLFLRSSVLRIRELNMRSPETKFLGIKSDEIRLHSAKFTVIQNKNVQEMSTTVCFLRFVSLVTV